MNKNVAKQNPSHEVIERSKLKKWLFFVFGGPFLLVGSLLLTNSESSGERAIGWFALFFFGAAFAMLFYRLITKSSIAMVLTPEGFYDYSTTKSENKLVPWGRVVDIRLHTQTVHGNYGVTQKVVTLVIELYPDPSEETSFGRIVSASINSSFSNAENDVMSFDGNFLKGLTKQELQQRMLAYKQEFDRRNATTS